MRIKIPIAALFSLFALLGYAQKNTLLKKAFHRHDQACDYSGTIEKDYVIELFGDSTITVAKYATSYVDRYNSLMRWVCSGTYTINGDTIIVKYITDSTDIKYKEPPRQLHRTKAPVINVVSLPKILPSRPPSVFIIKGKKIVSNYGELSLEEFPLSEMNLLIKKFNSWDKYTRTIVKKKIIAFD